MNDIPEIPILLLGDDGVGKSTFFSRLTLGSKSGPPQTLPTLRDLDQPFPFDIRLYNRSYRFLFSDTSSPTNFTLLKPSIIVLCYDISSPSTLHSLKAKWKYVVEMHFNYDESLPIIVLGLKRDVRSKGDYDGRVKAFHTDVDIMDDASEVPINFRKFVYPQEALRVAQEMRCDRYCECSALTGELCREVFEDIAKTAVMTTTEMGGKSAGTQCRIM
ncbi:hypothetical protein M433DRAFT_140772 [Acidomyces richmondensis BFW]|nr:MAG: hypothetical protein FE78DRAFT_74527 [Acidomyces sp. 'richmondensis']KYG48702.1 hypothetical protein M433DRAFT_140772 [Acidomyces richmondensis BFW]